MNKKIILIAFCVSIVLFLVGWSLNNTDRTLNIVEPLGKSENLSKSEILNKFNVTFVVQGSSYDVLVQEKTTVYDAMSILASTTPFRFKAKYHTGLGYFIEEINDIKNAQGTYWTLYVNGIYSTEGASSYVLKDKDSVEWKYEKK